MLELTWTNAGEDKIRKTDKDKGEVTMMKTYTILKARIYVKTYTIWIENKKKFNYKDYKNSKKYLNAKIKKIYDCLLQIKKKIV